VSKEKKIEKHPKIKLQRIEKNKHSVISLWDKTNEMAKAENKTTVLALCQKHRKGFWIVCHEDDLQDIIDAKNNN
jgi:hypothetical protein|tara:strand:- start:619 stop:843 length:225 start_codon:yes stop_codon:yes gene_type:complete